MKVRQLPYYYLAGAIVASAIAFIPTFLPVQLFLAWTAISLLCVASAYWLNSASLFRKNQDGRIPVVIRLAFIPFLLGATLYNAWARHRESVPALQQISEGLFVGRRLFPSDVEMLKQHKIAAVLDVTAEFDALDWSLSDADIHYLNIPVLDHASPSIEQIHQAIQWIDHQRRQHGAVLVHCALGRGRSVLMVAAYLLSQCDDNDVDKVMQHISDIRSTAKLNSHQRKCLKSYKQQHQLAVTETAWVIANPVSGGGKWESYQQPLQQALAPYFQLEILETTPEHDAGACAKDALQQGAKLVIACGGDGTLAAVAAALNGTETVMGVVPMGTANALSQVIWGVSSKLSPLKAATRTIIEGRKRAVDIACANEHTVLLCVGVGFEQQMIEQADREAKDRLGQLAYLQGLWQACQANQQLELQLRVDDGEQETLTTASVIVANAAPLTTLLAQGNGEPVVDDGKLDMTWLTPVDGDQGHWLSLAELLYQGVTEERSGERSNHRQVRSVELARADGEALKFVVDGEPYQAPKVKISVQPHAIQLLVSERLDY
ncbi:hypothetical protein CWI84_00165 [Idiomarina tyrosinivorans]|uniref:Diacylglycerol kinase n=1 Tax=Idiomarina tyrosinivorans TaxID=1445662 RepID=A0A432ZTH9_9GAMM|nr:diacylglycerol kinase family protein [Idiomarina tyrosinivorans]RUO81220.1 hypothetical protein CWI84_00165 [Idiomarina tyrosinivorans]